MRVYFSRDILLLRPSVLDLDFERVDSLCYILVVDCKGNAEPFFFYHQEVVLVLIKELRRRK